MNTSVWEKLGDQLRSLDRWGDFGSERTEIHRNDPDTWKWHHIDGHPVNIMLNSSIPPDHFPAYVPHLLHALEDLTGEEAGLEIIVRVLTKKGLTEAVEPLLRLYKDEALFQDLPCLWAVGNAVYHIEPHDHMDECLLICRDHRLGYSRHKLIVHLSRYKKSDEVFQTLLSLLEDESVRGAALEALRRYGDIRAIPAIERTPVRNGDEGIYETHQKGMALKKLMAKKSKS